MKKIVTLVTITLLVLSVERPLLPAVRKKRPRAEPRRQAGQRTTVIPEG
jgi:hypothetical protein